MTNQTVWTEGLFLRPQHFQQSDRFIEYQLNNRTQEAQANNFGFYDLQIDMQFLNSGIFAINKAHGIMPDGTFFYLDTKEYNLSINLTPSDSGKMIYLAIAQNIGLIDNISFETNNTKPTRMIATRINDIPNTNFGENTLCELLVSKYNFLLVKGEDLNDGYIKLPIAKIGNVTSSNIISLDNDFLSIYLHFGNSQYLMSQIKEIHNIIEFRVDKLSNKLIDMSVQISELSDYLLLQLLNKYYTKLEFYISQYKIHPQIIFLELYTFASELSVFMKKERKLNKRFAYTHLNLKSTYLDLFNEIKDMLSMVLEQNSVQIDVEKRKYGIYVAKIDDKSLLQDGTFIFSVSANISQDKLKKILIDNLKIGTIETIRDLVNYHLAGYKIKSLSTSPRQIPHKVNNLYFQIEFTTEDKTTLNKSGGLAFHLASEIENIEYDLWVIKNKTLKKRG